MKVEILRRGSPLPTICHEGTVYAKAPKKGRYTIRLTNDSCCKRCAVLTIDGINVINGKDAGYDGPGWILDPRESIVVEGWKRGADQAAAFTFEEQAESYANQTGRGTTNVGVIGVAVFEEAVPLVVHYPRTYVEHHHHHHHSYPKSIPCAANTVTADSTAPGPAQVLCSTSSLGAPIEREERTGGGITRSVGATRKRAKAVKDVGTGYGHEVEFKTTQTRFERRAGNPWAVITIRYATKVRLESWGVSVEAMRAGPAPRPSAFPREAPFVPAPAGWRG